MEVEIIVVVWAVFSIGILWIQQSRSRARLYPALVAVFYHKNIAAAAAAVIPVLTITMPMLQPINIYNSLEGATDSAAEPRWATAGRAAPRPHWSQPPSKFRIKKEGERERETGHT